MIDIKFRNKNRIKLLDIIFPHVWQINFNKNDENYKEKNEKNLRVRIQILKEIIRFVNKTQRFNGDFGE